MDRLAGARLKYRSGWIHKIGSTAVGSREATGSSREVIKIIKVKKKQREGRDEEGEHREEGEVRCRAI